MKQAIQPIKLDLHTVHLALVVSRYNEEICMGLLDGAMSAFKEAEISRDQLEILRVPGAFEIPLAAKQCAETGYFNGIVCLGAVIRGETPHFDTICQSVAYGIQRVTLDHNLPIGFGILTTHNLDQAKARSAQNPYNKGREAAYTVLEMISTLHSLRKPKH